MRTSKLDSIQFLRGIAAILVIAFHYRLSLNGRYAQQDLGDILFIMGEIGVDIFFVISGFIIALSTERENTNKPSVFFVKRFFRLYPLFFIVLTLFIFLIPNLNLTDTKIIKSYLLIPNDYNAPGPWYGYNINYPSWTLTYELFFYFIFGISIFISHRYRIAVSILLLILICTISQIYFRGEIHLSTSTRDAAADSFLRNLIFVSNPIIYDFIYGMIIYWIYERFRNKTYIKNDYSKLFFVIIMCSSIILFLSGYNKGAGISRWGFCSFLLVLSVLFVSDIVQIKFSRFFVFLGEISYSLYINHIFVQNIFLWYMKKYDAYKNAGGFTIFITLLLITFCISIITYILIEKPSIKLGRMISEKLSKRPYKPM